MGNTSVYRGNTSDLVSIMGERGGSEFFMNSRAQKVTVTLQPDGLHLLRDEGSLHFETRDIGATGVPDYVKLQSPNENYSETAFGELPEVQQQQAQTLYDESVGDLAYELTLQRSGMSPSIVRGHKLTGMKAALTQILFL